jgi:hypothetical protein
MHILSFGFQMRINFYKYSPEKPDCQQKFAGKPDYCEKRPFFIAIVLNEFSVAVLPQSHAVLCG